MTTTASALRQNQRQADRFYCQRHPDGRLTGVVDGHIPYRCAPCHAEGLDTTLIERGSPTKKFLLGEELPFAVEQNIAEKIGDRSAMTTALAERDFTNVGELDITAKQLADVGKKMAEYMPSYGVKGAGALSMGDQLMAAQLVTGLGMHPSHFTVMQHRSRGEVTSTLYINMTGREFLAQHHMGATFGGVEIDPMSADDRELWGLFPGYHDPGCDATKTGHHHEDCTQAEVGVKATLYKVLPNGHRFPYQQDIGRAGGPRDDNQPVAKANLQEQAIARATVRVLKKGVPLGLDIGSFVSGSTIIDVPGNVIDTNTGEIEALPEGAGDEAATLGGASGVPDGPATGGDTGAVVPSSADNGAGDAAPLAHDYAWPEPDGVQKKLVGASDPEFMDTMQLIAENGFNSEPKIKFLTFLTGETGGKAIIAAVRGGFHAQQILDALRAQNPQQAAMDMEPEAEEEEVENLPW